MTKQSPAPRTLLAATLCLAAIHARSQQAEWASLIHGMSSVNSLCRDANQNIYVTGRMSSGDIDGTPIDVYGTYDIFLAKYNPGGTLQWAVRAGGSDPMDFNERDSGWKVIYDSISDAIYLSGTYQGTTTGNPAYFGPGIEVQGKGAFLAKYNGEGTCLWMRATNNGGSASIAIDADGAVYVTCWSTDELSDSTTYFGPPSITLANGSSIAKYSPAGQLIWAKNIGQNIDGQLLALGNHILFGGGTFYGSSSFLGTPIPDDGSDGLGFIASMDTACSSIEWMHILGSSMLSYVSDFKVVGDSKLLVIGGYMDSLFISTDTLLGTIDTYRPFYLLMDSSGEIIWSSGINADISFYSLSPASDGSFYLGFEFTSSFTMLSDTVTANNAWDFAIVHCQSDGSPIGLLHNGPVDPVKMDILAMENGVAVSGRFSGTIDLGGGYVFAGNNDAFVAKYGIITRVQSYALSGGEGQLLIYANPNQGTCSIDLPPELLHEQGLVLRILDAQGQVVQEGPLNITEGTVHLDIRAQAAGTYVAEVVSGTTRYTGRIVFE